MRILRFVLAISLSGCAPTHPLVDMSDVDPVAYQRVLDRCELVNGTSDVAGPVVAGTLIGASFGLGLATVFTVAPFGAAAAGYGAGGGGAVGAGAATLASNTPVGDTFSSHSPQNLDECLTAHGYKVTGHI
jgi:hypothetical protein